MLETILTPLNGTAAAEIGLTWAQNAASRSGATLRLLVVVNTTEHEANGHVEEAEKYLRWQRDRIAATGLNVDTDIAVGSPGEEILKRAAGAELTVMTYTTSLWLHGGALDLVIKNMVNPLVVVRGQEGRPSRQFECEKVLVPVDSAAHSKDVLPTAVNLSRALGASLVLCRIVAPIPGAYDRSGPPPEIARLIEEETIEADLLLAKTAKESQEQGVTAECFVSIGDPAREIIRAARECGAGLIAMATRGTNSMSRMLGSVALGVVQASPIPCLLVRPPADQQAK